MSLNRGRGRRSGIDRRILVIATVSCSLSTGVGSAVADCVVDLPWKLYASDPDAGDEFGHAVDMDGDVAIVGAYRDEPFGFHSGSAYVYRFGDTGWTFEAKLVPDDGAASDYFGYAVAIDGDRAVVGAYGDDDIGSGSGAAYVFQYDGSSWVQETKLHADDGGANDYFGCAVGIDGWSIVVGAFNEDDNGVDAGAAYAFRYSESAWAQEAKLLASDGDADDRFGQAIAITTGGTAWR
jgi:hypothetical protein